VADFRLETERLVLRSWRDADREPFWAMAQDQAVMRYLPALDRAGSDNVIERMDAAQHAHGCCFWAIECKADARFVGFCGIMAPRPPLTEYEIGWRLASDSWGQGIAREAAQASLDWAWTNLAASSVVAITVPENTRSWGLMQRLGMTRDPAEDFDHPSLPAGDPLRHHVLYRIRRPD
jgi:RimJ/RimL family protein N-acetyltransferase